MHSRVLVLSGSASLLELFEQMDKYIYPGLSN